MIDQLPTAVPQAAQSVNTAGRDRKQASAEKDDQAGSFEDIVSKTGQQQTRQGKSKDAEVDPQLRADVKQERTADARPKVAFELSAALRGLGTSVQTQVQAKIAAKDAVKTVDVTDKVGRQQSQVVAKDVLKTTDSPDKADQLRRPILAKDALKTVDLADKAGQQQSRLTDTKNDEVELDLPGKGHATDLNFEVAPEFAAPRHDFGTSAEVRTEVRTKIVASDAHELTDSADQADQLTDAAIAARIENLRFEIRHAAQTSTQAKYDADVDDRQSLTPSDEIGLLLGLEITTSKEVETKHDKKSMHAATVEERDDEASASRLDQFAAKTDVVHAEQITVPANAKHSNDGPALEDKPTQSDVVKLVSANGRGRSIDIEVTPTSVETQRDTAKPATTSRVDTATVLEARRYLGFTPEPNATALATAIKADPTWTEALQAAQSSDLSSLGNTVTEVNTLKLQMNPENLGNMVASLKLKGEELTVELRVDSVEAYQQLSADHDEIVKGLQDQGFSIDKVTVQLNATDRTDTGADRDATRQGQTQRDEQAQQRDGRDGQSKRNDGQREQPRWTSSGTLSDGAAGDGRADPGRSGNIYL